MKKFLLTLLFLLPAGAVFAQTAGEKESFETMKKAANTYLVNGDYAAAKAQYEGIFKLFRQYESLTKEVRSDYEKSLRELDKIAASRKESERLVFSEPFVNFSYSPETHRVNVLAGKGGTGKWEVESWPDWCTLNRNDNTLDITVEQNPDPTFRNSEIVIKMTVSGKKVTRGLPVLQIARPLQERSIRIITNPAGALITVGNDPTPRISPVTLTVKEGEIPVHILRNDYYTIDTYITVSADDDPKVTKEYRYDMVSRFALAKLTLKAGTGNLDNKNPTLFIGGKKIDLDGYYGRGGVKTIHTAGAIINHYDLYLDAEHNFVIPLEPATYQVTVTAEDFEDYNYTFTAREGETFPLDIVMTPKRGTIRFFSGKNAEGTVIKDGMTPIGTLTNQLEVQLTADDHKISFEKKDYVSEVPLYTVHINPGETTDFEVNMEPLSYLTINTEPAGVEVIINDVSEGIRTPVLNKAIPLGINTIVLQQKNYYPAKLTHTSTAIGQKDTLNVSLMPSHPLKISSDSYRSSRSASTGFNIYIQSLEKGCEQVREFDHYTDAIINLPYGKYSYEFRRYSHGPTPGYADGIKLRGEKKSKDLAYKGVFRFNEKHDVLNRMSYSETNCFSALWGNLPLTNSQIQYGTEGVNTFKEIGSAGFMKIPLWTGFSTSLLRGTVFKGLTDDTTPKFLFNATCLLLNGEERIGGSLHQNLDANLLVSYAWLPHLKDFEWLRSAALNLNYVDMTEIFVGLELHSRFPVLNANFRFGYRFQKGYVNIYSEKAFSNYPFDNSGLFASVGFTLGGKDSKGANIMRVFYL